MLQRGDDCIQGHFSKNLPFWSAEVLASHDFCYLLSMIKESFMSRANSIVIPGGKLDLAMQLILTPLILQLVERKQRAS